MSDLRTAAQQALDVLETTISSHGNMARSAITALRAALEQPQRHVSYVCPQCHWSLEQPEQPYAEQARRVEQETHGRMRIDPVTGDVSIGTPAKQPEEDWEAVAADQAMTIALLKSEREPVAWMVYTLDGKSVCVTDNPQDFSEAHRALPLFTHPSRREWRSLSDDELTAFGVIHSRYQEESLETGGWFDFARAIEAALKERNA